jgi:hypothetical protein
VSEKPLPTRSAVEDRIKLTVEEMIQVEMELGCHPWWRWHIRRNLRRRLAYLRGLGEGLRLAST